MKLDDGVAWGNIVGGFAGLGSLFIVLFDKWRTRPMLLTSVRKANFRNEGGTPYGGEPRVFLNVSLEIGNIGSEATTITRADLHLQDGKILDAKDHRNISGGFTLIVDDYSTRVCEKGMAFIENLKFYFNGGHSSEAQLQGTLVLTLLGGKKHKQSVIFKNKE